MFAFFNRLAWLISFSFGCALTYYFVLLEGTRNGIDFYLLTFFCVILSLIVKKTILSAQFISTALKEFGVQETPNPAPAEEEEEGIDDHVPVRQTVFSEASSPKQEIKAQPEIELHELEQRQQIWQQEHESEAAFRSRSVSAPQPVVPNKAQASKASHKTEIPLEDSKAVLFLRNFFKENVLAKVGGILLFLGVFFLLQLVYIRFGSVFFHNLGPMGKIILGFLVAMTLYGIGVFLDGKKYIRESRVLLGTALLANYLVIFSGRYLLEGAVTESSFLSEGVAFALLVFNTVFAVATALYYRTNVLLLFAFVFAYAIPFLVGAEGVTTPYTLVGYSLCVTFGAIAVSQFDKKMSPETVATLLRIVTVGGILLVLAAPFENPIEWTVKLVALAILSVWMLLLFAKQKNHQDLLGMIIGSYGALFILILLGSASLGTAFDAAWIFFAYVVALVGITLFTTFAFFTFGLYSLLISLFMPLILIVFLIANNVISAALSLPAILLFFGIFVFIFLHLDQREHAFRAQTQLIFPLVIGIFLLTGQSLILFEQGQQSLPFLQTALTIGMTLAYLWFAYYYARRPQLAHLYPVGTVLAITSLSMLVEHTGELVLLSMIGIGGLMIPNVLLPLVDKKMQKIDPIYLIIGLLVAALFASGELYLFGKEYFSGVAIGVGYFLLAWIYFVFGFIAFSQHQSRSEDKDQQQDYHFVASFIGIAVSLFTLSIAFVFADHDEIVSAAWLFEATVAFLFFARLRSLLLYILGCILMAIGAIKFIAVIEQIEAGDMMMAVSLGAILASLAANLWILRQADAKIRITHDCLHVLTVILLGVAVLALIPNPHETWGMLSIAIFMYLLSEIYARMDVGQISLVFTGALMLLFIIHVIQLQNLIMNGNVLGQPLDPRLIHTINAGLITMATLRIGQSGRLPKETRVALIVALLGYLFIVSTQLIYFILFENVFVITIYWGLLAFGFTLWGINLEKIALRSLGLNILILVVAKILLYDIWVGLDGAFLRVIALMGTGALMIVLSILYSKKYGNTIRKEISLTNLWNQL